MRARGVPPAVDAPALLGLAALLAGLAAPGYAWLTLALPGSDRLLRASLGVPLGAAMVALSLYALLEWTPLRLTPLLAWGVAAAWSIPPLGLLVARRRGRVEVAPRQG